MEGVGALASQFGCLEHKPAADVKKDEACHNRRVAEDPGTSLRLQRDVGRERKVLRTNEETANNKTDHSDQNARGQEVRQQVERPPQASARIKRHKALEHINEID